MKVAISRTYVKDVFTARNGEDFSATKLIAFMAALAMIGEFVVTHSQNYLQLGLGIGAIMAALAGKYFVETPYSHNEDVPYIRPDA